MKNIGILFSTMLTVLIFSACNSGPCNHENCCGAIDESAVKSEIMNLEAAFSDAMNSRDVDALMAYYADDAQSMSPNEPTLVGAEAIRASTAEAWSGEGGEGYTSSGKTTDVWAAGDIAVETGTYSVNNAEGEEVHRGKYMALYEKRDGKYVCIRDIWNSSMPKEKDDAHDHEHDHEGESHDHDHEHDHDHDHASDANSDGA